MAQQFFGEQYAEPNWLGDMMGLGAGMAPMQPSQVGLSDQGLAQGGWAGGVGLQERHGGITGYNDQGHAIYGDKTTDEFGVFSPSHEGWLDKMLGGLSDYAPAIIMGVMGGAAGGLFGGGAAAGAEAGVAGGMTAEEAASLGLGADFVGATPIAGGAAETMGAAGTGVLDYGGAGSGWGAAFTDPTTGLSYPGSGMGGGANAGALASGGSSGSGLGGLWDTVLKKAGGLSAIDYARIASGAYGLYGSMQQQKLAKQEAGVRKGYQDQLGGLTSNPSSITSMPGYQAGLEGVQRSLAAQGYTGSGNMMAALAKYGGDFYGQEVSRLAGLSGMGTDSNSVAAQQQAALSNQMSALGLMTGGFGGNKTTSLESLMKMFGRTPAGA